MRAFQPVLPIAALAAATVLLPAVGSPLRAQELRTVTIALDNDGLTFWTPPSRRDDWYYTHGTRFEATIGGVLPVLDRWWLADLPPCVRARDPEAPCGLTRASLGQEIYTPRALFSFVPPEGDRPYAGWLYAALSSERIEPERRTALAVEVGVTGGPSGGRAAHLAVHRWLGKTEPFGWAYQLPFEIGFTAQLERNVYVGPGGSGGGIFQLEPHGAIRLGTVRTGAEAGLAVRLGWNAPAGTEYGAPPREGGFLLIRAGAQGEVVFRDLFLDGATWARSLSAERELMLGRLHATILFGGGGIALRFGAVKSTPAFEAQNRAHTYATVALVFGR